MDKDSRLNKNSPLPPLAPYLKKGRMVIIQEMLYKINKDLGNCEKNMDEKLDKIEENMDEKLDRIEETMNEKLDKIEERILFLINTLI